MGCFRYHDGVRLLLLLLLPALLALFWLLLRQYAAMRMAERARCIDAKVTDARSFAPGEAQPDSAPAPDAPSCGRHDLHLFLRLAGAGGACRHCAALRRAEQDADAAAAVEAAERALRGERRR